MVDLLSNVLMASGTVAAVELYEPYGQMNYSWGSMPTDKNYTGQQLDSQSGLLYYQFRWYDPLTGEFTRTDTKQDNANGMNPYAYVSDNPETKNDPTGHWGLGDILTFTAIAVVVVVVVVVVIVAAPIVAAAAVATAATVVATASASAAAFGAGLGVSGAITLGYAASVLGPALSDAGADAASIGDSTANAADNSCEDVDLCGGNGNGQNRVQNLRNTNQVSIKKNIAVMDYNVNGDNGSEWSSSGSYTPSGANPGPSGSPTFTAVATGNNSRLLDSEYKLLNWFGEAYPPESNPYGSVNLYTERPPCSSCSGVIAQFRSLYNYVNLTVRWGPGFFI
jgi:RHS repeat-associated protein